MISEVFNRQFRMEAQAIARKENFIFEEKGRVLMGNQFTFLLKKYLPCDLKAIDRESEALVATHLDLCNKPFETIIDAGSHLLHPDGITENFIALNNSYTRMEASRICQSFGTTFAEVKTGPQLLELASLMGQLRFTSIYSGVVYDQQTQEYIFESTGQLAANTIFQKVFNAHDRNGMGGGRERISELPQLFHAKRKTGYQYGKGK